MSWLCGRGKPPGDCEVRTEGGVPGPRGSEAAAPSERLGPPTSVHPHLLLMESDCFLTTRIKAVSLQGTMIYILKNQVITRNCELRNCKYWSHSMSVTTTRVRWTGERGCRQGRASPPRVAVRSTIAHEQQRRVWAHMCASAVQVDMLCQGNLEN